MGDRRFKFQELRDRGVLDFGDGYRAKNAELEGEGPIFLRAAYLQDSGFVLNDPDRFKENSAEKFGPKVAQIGDVVITTKGNSTGRIGVIREPESGSVYSPHLSYWRSLDRDFLDQRFLYYWSRSEDFRQQLYGLAYATDMAPYLSLRDQATLTVPIPPIEKQRLVASILGAFDDKIELNRRMNETLEAMARAIFKDWFVDFGPTRAKAEGREPYLAPETWDLFPDRLDDEDKPVGWECVALSAFMDFKGGSQPPAKEFINEPRPGYIRLLQIRDFDTDTHVTFVPEQNRLRLVESNDICIGRYGSGTGDEKDSLGRLCRGLSGAINVALVRVEPKFDCREWLATYIGSGLFRRDISGGSARAVQAGFRKEDLNHIKVVRASDDIHAEFEKLGMLVWQHRKKRQTESNTLAQTRDLLLPKLMSGEIRLHDAQKVVEAVA